MHGFKLSINRFLGVFLIFLVQHAGVQCAIFANNKKIKNHQKLNENNVKTTETQFQINSKRSYNGRRVKMKGVSTYKPKSVSTYSFLDAILKVTS